MRKGIVASFIGIALTASAAPSAARCAPPETVALLDIETITVDGVPVDTPSELAPESVRLVTYGTADSPSLVWAGGSVQLGESDE